MGDIDDIMAMIEPRPWKKVPVLDPAVIVALEPYAAAQTDAGMPDDQSVLTEVFQMFVGRTLVEVIHLQWEDHEASEKWHNALIREGWRVDLSPMAEFVMDVRPAFEAEPLRSYFFNGPAMAWAVIHALLGTVNFNI